MLDVGTGIDLLLRGGVVAALAIAIWGGKQGWYIWEKSHTMIVDAINKGHKENIETLAKENDELRDDRDYWRKHALEALNAAQRAVTLADKAAG